MGKALLILVMGTGLLLALSQVSTSESLVRTAAQQGQYGEEVVAREIARSGFNVAMGIARQHGSDIYAAITAINADGGLRREHQGGEYVVEAYTSDGFTINIESTGYFGGEWRNGEYEGGGTHVMKDSYQVLVLRAKTCSTLHARFLESEAGYCSGVYLQRHLAGADALTTPEMIFPVGRNGDNTELQVDKTIAPGTQMDFFIGVDQNCSSRYGGPLAPSWYVRQYKVEDHVFNAADYNHIHHGIEYPFDSFEYITESVWSFINQHPDNDQKWRIGWEDQHITRWDNENSTNPRSSLQALKRYGYDGNGWPDTDRFGYPDFRDYGDRPDFSDQVIEVWLVPLAFADWPQECHDAMAVLDREGDSEPTPGGGEDDGEPTGGEPTDGEPTDGEPTDGDDDKPDDDEPTDGEPTDGEPTGGEPTDGEPTDGDGDGGATVDCPCPRGNNDKKVYIRHFPRGNRNNPQDICIGRPAWITQGHSIHDGDFIICEGD